MLEHTLELVTTYQMLHNVSMLHNVCIREKYLCTVCVRMHASRTGLQLTAEGMNGSKAPQKRKLLQ